MTHDEVTLPVLSDFVYSVSDPSSEVNLRSFQYLHNDKLSTFQVPPIFGHCSDQDRWEITERSSKRAKGRMIYWEKCNSDC